MPKLFKTDVASDADLKVFITDIQSEAHMVVYETSDPWLATESSIWCYTDMRSEADKVVHFTTSRWEADLIIFQTDIQPDAGWQDSTKEHLM